MARNLGGAIIDLLDSDQLELRVAAATVLAAVGKGDRSAEAALADRLADADVQVRQIALDALADMGTPDLAPKLVPLLRGDDVALAERARQLLAQHGAAAEPALRKEVGAGPIAARRVMAQLLLRRGTRPAIEAVLDQLSDDEFGEPALQLVRAELDRGEPGTDQLATVIEKAAIARAGDARKALDKAWAAAHRVAAPAARAGGKPKRPARPAPTGGTGQPPADPLRDPDVVRGIAALGNLLRLIGYLARPTTQPLLLTSAAAGQPQPIRLAAIAGLRRLVAQGDATPAPPGGSRASDRATKPRASAADAVIEAMIGFADDDDPAIAQAAVDTLRGARIPEALARPFADLARGKHPFAQQLAMERLPAGGGASAMTALIDALGGDDPTARDAAGRGLAKAPEAVLPVTRALIAATDEHIARRYAGILRSHRGHAAPQAQQAIDELVDHLREAMDRHARGKASADEIILERVVTELVWDLAPARHVALLFDRAKRLRKAGKTGEAFALLKPLLRSRADLDTAMDDEQRFLLAVLALEAAGEGLLRTARTDDPVFAQVAQLAAKDFPVARRLARERDVSDEAIYALGFRLLEASDGAHQDLGAELLEGIIDERPRSRLAKAAKNKLRLTGHRDDD
jgi:hypothetical protein